MADRKINTGLTEAEVHTAFYRALHDLTDAQIQALIAAEAETRSQHDDSLENAVSQLDITCDAMREAEIRQIDSGAKNRLTINSGSSTPPTRWIDIPVSIAPGTYHVFFGNLASDDTDAETCQMTFFDSSMQQASGWLMLPRGENVSGVITITAAASAFRLYPSNSYANSAGDTVTFTNAMLCAADDWAISQRYVPYCPSMPELYQMIQNIQSGRTRAAAVQAETEDADA